MSGRAARGTRSRGWSRLRPSSRAAAGGRRRLLVLAVAGLAAAVVIGLTRIDLGGTIRELTLPLRHDDIIRQQAREKDVDAALIAAVINVESRFVEGQTSEAGARGLMQITPDTAEVIERLSGGETFVTEDLADPDINIRYGTFYLRHLLGKYDGNRVAALAAYNAGEANADRWGGASLRLGEIPFPETREYVRAVRARHAEYRRHYPGELGLGP